MTDDANFDLYMEMTDAELAQEGGRARSRDRGA